MNGNPAEQCGCDIVFNPDREQVIVVPTCFHPVASMEKTCIPLAYSKACRWNSQIARTKIHSVLVN